MDNSKKLKVLKIIHQHLVDKGKKEKITPKQQANLTTLLIKMEQETKKKINGKREN